MGMAPDPMPLVLCEHATFHADGTYTIVRGGISFWRASLPIELSLVAFIQVPRDTIPPGDSPLSIDVRYADGQVIRHQDGSVVLAPSDAAVTYLAVPITGTVQRAGNVIIDVRIKAASWSAELDVRPQ
jgi:hypothetical protein